MPKLTVTLETVTPLFLAGADNRTPELRPASFRGALRFWLRALLGASFGSDLDGLREAESAVFGNTDGASPIVVRVSARTQPGLAIGDRRPLIHTDAPGRTFSLPAFAEGGQFTLTLASRPGQSCLPQEALASLLLMLNLGGVGKRSRRGFGSLRVVQARPQDLVLPDSIAELLENDPEDGGALAEYLAEVLGRCQSPVTAMSGLPYPAGALPDYAVLSDDHARVLVCRHAFPRLEHPYGQAMVDFWQKALRRSPYRDQGEFGYAKRIDLPGGGRQRKKTIRRASPLIVHIAQSRDGYHLVLTAFRSHLSADPDYYRTGDWSLVESFLHECASKWDGAFVFGKGGWK